MSNTPRFGQYSHRSNTSEFFNGAGYLSLGGNDRVDFMVNGIDLSEKRVADLGSGLGGPARHLVTQHGAFVECVEIDPDLALCSEQRALEWGITDSIKLHNCSFERLPFDDASIDVVFSKEVIVHLPPEEKAALFCEINRVLKPGGRMVIMDWFRANIPPSELYQQRLEADGFDLRHTSLDPYLSYIKDSGLYIDDIANMSVQYYLEFHNRVQHLTSELNDQAVQTIGRDDVNERLAAWSEHMQLLSSQEVRAYYIAATRIEEV